MLMDEFGIVGGNTAKVVVVLMSVVGVLASVIIGQFHQEFLTDNTNSNSVFVFEVVRHGARAPMYHADSSDFQVALGMLTAQGMRQRYLLGRWNKWHFERLYGFNGTLVNFEE